MSNRSRCHHEVRASAAERAERAAVDDLVRADAPWDRAAELLEVMIARLVDDARAAAEQVRSSARQGLDDEVAACVLAHLAEEGARAAAAAEAESAAAHASRSRAVEAVTRLRTSADAVAVRLHADLTDLRTHERGLRALLGAVREVGCVHTGDPGDAGVDDGADR